MNAYSFLSRLCHPQSADIAMITLIALAWSTPVLAVRFVTPPRVAIWQGSRHRQNTPDLVSGKNNDGATPLYVAALLGQHGRH